MAWEISITAEGWQEIREKLDDWSREALIDAICRRQVRDWSTRRPISTTPNVPPMPSGSDWQDCRTTFWQIGPSS